MKILNMRPRIGFLMVSGTSLAAIFDNSSSSNYAIISKTKSPSESSHFPEWIPRHPPPPVPDYIQKCDLLHVIIAGGSGQNLAKNNTWVDLKNKHLKGSMVHFIDYPATSIGYDESVQEGAFKLKGILANLIFASSCPNANRIVMMGYGQGAQIMQDALCGGGATEANTEDEKRILGPHVRPAWVANANIVLTQDTGTVPGPDIPSQEILDQIVAVIQISDPRKSFGNGIYHVGSSKNNGVLPRKFTDPTCDKFTMSKFRSYCDHNDPLCDSGYDMNIDANHYKQKYKQDPYDFIGARLKDFPNDEKAREEMKRKGQIEVKAPDPKTWTDRDWKENEEDAVRRDEEDRRRMEREMLRQVGMVQG